jgi:hypothetical protein
MIIQKQVLLQLDSSTKYTMKGCCDAQSPIVPCNTDNPPPNKLCHSGKKGGRGIFNQAVIYYPKDERVLNQIYKDIAAFHCQATLNYLNANKLENHRTKLIINSLLQDMRNGANPDHISESA